jgi:16S rRNA (cytosine1402-N4)-methyltransferase
LADLVRAAVSPPQEADALARTFQALRIAVNEELKSLEALLREAPRWLGRGGRLVVISFHSLEDRQVKQALVRGERAGIFEVLTDGPVGPSSDEVERNPRSRSARLRAARKLLVTGGKLPERG